MRKRYFQMAEAGAAGAGGAAAGATGAVGAAGVTAPASATGSSAAPPAAGGNGAAAGATGAAAEGAWLGMLSAENRGHVLAKGANDINDVVKGWKAAESLVGYPKERIIALPADPKGFQDFAEAYSRLGAPAAAADYGLKPDPGTPPEFTAGMAEALKDARITKDQAAVLIPKYGELVKSLTAASQAAAVAKATADKQALSAKWGAAADQNTAIAKGVARKFGASEEAIRAMDSVVGHTALMEFLHNIGRGLGEHNFVDGSPGVGIITPDQAKTERENAMSDKTSGGWTERYLKGGTKEKQQMQTWLAAEVGLDVRELK